MVSGNANFKGSHSRDKNDRPSGKADNIKKKIYSNISFLNKQNIDATIPPSSAMFARIKRLAGLDVADALCGSNVVARL
jgi:hypothetical protein